MAAQKDTFQFEKALNDLEGLVQAMEKGDLSLEKALAHFEQGIGLIRNCQKELKMAEQKVMQLSGKEDAFTLEPFNTDSIESHDTD